MNEIRQRTGHLIKSARLSRNLTQKQVGELVDMSESQVGRYENGGSNISLDTLALFADKLGYSLNLFFDFK